MKRKIVVKRKVRAGPKKVRQPVAHEQLSKRDTLINEYTPFVHKVAKRLSLRMNLPAALYDEFVSAGYMGLVEAAERYNPKQGREFRAYAFLRIRGAIIDYIRSNSDISSAAYRHAKAFKAAQELREEQWERAQTRGKPLASDVKIAQMFEYAARSVMAHRLTVADAEVEMSESDQNEDPEQELLASEDAHRLKMIVSRLPEKEREVIEQYYFKDKSFHEILDENEEFSKSWLSRLHSRALELLKDQIIMEERRETGISLH